MITTITHEEVKIMNYTFESIAGYEKEKAELMRLCEIFNDRKKYEAKGAKLPKGIVLYGEAGTGKTLFAKVMASVCGLRIFRIDLGEVKNESAICKAIRATFKRAGRCGEPAMVFFDEVDKVLPNYREGYVTDRSKTVLTQLLTLIDGMDSAKNIVFVATCNSYSALPPTLTRPGRIDKKIGIGLPNYSSRVAILKMYAGRTSCRFEMTAEEIAKLVGNLSCAGLETLINECVLQSDSDGFVSRNLIQERFFEIKHEDIPRAGSSIDDTVRACRNIGAFVVAKTINDGGYVLNLEHDTACNDFFDGLLSEFDSDYNDDYDDDEEDYEDDEEEDDGRTAAAKIYSKSDLLNAITVRLGGYAAEEIILHTLYDNLQYDLSLIDGILFSMSQNGMFGFACRFSEKREDIMFYSDAWTDRLYAVFDETVEECLERARAIVKKNEGLIKKLMPVLTEKRVIEKKDCEPILKSLGGIRK